MLTQLVRNGIGSQADVEDRNRRGEERAWVCRPIIAVAGSASTSRPRGLPILSGIKIELQLQAGTYRGRPIE
jgi:hypothetical protein